MVAVCVCTYDSCLSNGAVLHSNVLLLCSSVVYLILKSWNLHWHSVLLFISWHEHSHFFTSTHLGEKCWFSFCLMKSVRMCLVLHRGNQPPMGRVDSIKGLHRRRSSIHRSVATQKEWRRLTVFSVDMIFKSNWLGRFLIRLIIWVYLFLQYAFNFEVAVCKIFLRWQKLTLMKKY